MMISVGALKKDVGLYKSILCSVFINPRQRGSSVFRHSPNLQTTADSNRPAAPHHYRLIRRVTQH